MHSHDWATDKKPEHVVFVFCALRPTKPFQRDVVELATHVADVRGDDRHEELKGLLFPGSLLLAPAGRAASGHGPEAWRGCSRRSFEPSCL